METTTLETFIKYFQCLLAKKYQKEWSNNLVKGICVNETKEKLILVNSLIDIFYRYNTIGTVTNAWSITLNRTNTTLSVTYVLVINSVVIASYTGTGSTQTILEDFLLEIKDNGYNGFLEGNTLFIYSTENTELFTYQPTIEASLRDTLTYSVESLKNKLYLFTNKINCLSVDELCIIKNKILQILN